MKFTTTVLLPIASLLFPSALALPTEDAGSASPGFSRYAPIEARDKPKLNQYRTLADW